MLLVFFGNLLLLAAWLSPLHLPPWAAFANDAFAFAGLILLLGQGLQIARSHGLRVPRSVLWLIAVACVPMLQVASGLIVFSGDGWVAALYVVALALAVVTGCNLQFYLSGKFSEALAVTLTTGAVLSTLIAISQWLHLGWGGVWVLVLAPGDRPFANLAQPNQMASLLMMGLIGCLHLYERRRLNELSLSAMAGLLLLGLTLSQSRTVWIAMPILAAGWAYARRNTVFRLSVRGMGSLLVVYFSLVLTWPWFADLMVQGGGSSIQRGLQPGVRLIIWRELLDAALRSPWVGYGWNQVSMAQTLVAADFPASEWVEHAHSLILDLMLWNGIPIGAMSFIGLIYWLWSTGKKSCDLDVWFGLAVILTMLVHASLEYPHDYAYFLIPVGLAAGIVESRTLDLKIIHVRWFWGAPLFLGFSCISAGVFIEYRQIEADYRQLRFSAAGLLPRTPGDPAPNIVVLTQLREFMRFRFSVEDVHEGMKPEDLEWMEKVVHRYPYKPALFRYALALALNGQPDAASLELRRIKSLYGEKAAKEVAANWRAIATGKYPKIEKIALP